MWSIYALTDLYGVELLMDNVIECRERLYLIWRHTLEAKAKIVIIVL